MGDGNPETGRDSGFMRESDGHLEIRGLERATVPQKQEGLG